MDSKNNSILTGDGQRLNVQNGAITGSENPEKGLAFDLGPVQPGDEKKPEELNQPRQRGGTCKARKRKKG